MTHPVISGQLVYEVSWVPDLLAGNTVKEVGDKYEGDLLDGNSFRAWLEACQKARASVRQPNILSRQVHLSYGDRLARDYVQELACDVFIHSWDLAKGIGGDDRLDDGLVKIFYEQIKLQADVIRSSGLFGGSLKVPLDSNMQTKFLALVGRKN